MVFSRGKEIFKKRFTQPTNRTLVVVGTTCALGAIVAYASFRTIPAGHIGYKNLFGEVSSHKYNSGYTFINPFARMVRLNLQKQVYHAESKICTNEGLEVTVDVDVIFRLDVDKAREVYVNCGYQYGDVLLVPQLKSHLRDILSGYDAKDLYNDTTRSEIKTKMLENLVNISQNGVIVDDVLISKIVLPTTLTRSIENKLQAEQEMQKMDFLLEKERKEAERKKIEASGIKDFQDIVSTGISERLLEWKGITATEELAKSANTKVVIIGNSKSGLPLIFDSKKE